MLTENKYGELDQSVPRYAYSWTIELTTFFRKTRGKIEGKSTRDPETCVGCDDLVHKLAKGDQLIHKLAKYVMV